MLKGRDFLHIICIKDKAKPPRVFQEVGFCRGGQIFSTLQTRTVLWGEDSVLSGEGFPPLSSDPLFCLQTKIIIQSSFKNSGCKPCKNHSIQLTEASIVQFASDRPVYSLSFVGGHLNNEKFAFFMQSFKNFTRNN